ncbi:MAG: hypothetical protein AB8B89_10030 [Gammaproteobacteria bacterium]
MLGAITAITILALCTYVGFYSIESSIVSIIVLSFLIWLAVLLLSYFTKPSKVLPFCKSLSAPEVKAYQTYHLYLSKPEVSVFLSALINVLRFLAIVWSALAIWFGLYWQGGLCMSYFFVAANLIKILSPWSVMGAKAEKGNKIARKQLYLVDLVQIKLNEYNDEKLN